MAVLLVLMVLVGLKEAVTPLGSVEKLKFTLPLNPFSGWTDMVLLPPVPGTMLKLPGEADRKKLGPDPGQLFTRLAILTVPIPVAKSQPVFVLYAEAKTLLSVDKSPTAPPPR